MFYWTCGVNILICAWGPTFLTASGAPPPDALARALRSLGLKAPTRLSRLAFLGSPR